MLAYHFFNQSPNIIKPYALMDLDDTLFQTQRKIQKWQLDSQNLTVASVNKQGEPLSFFTEKQSNFFNWLSQSCELIPVTARDFDEMFRVKLPFHSWQILTHGAIMLEPSGNLNSDWQQHINNELAPLQQKFTIIEDFLTRLNEQDNLGLSLTFHQADCLNQQKIYLAVKQQQKNEQLLINLAKILPALFANDLPNFDKNFYIHVNANNLAILPKCVHKRHAVAFLLTQLDNKRACFGFGDSLADFAFLQQLDWYGTPNHGQLHDYMVHAVGNFLGK